MWVSMATSGALMLFRLFSTASNAVFKNTTGPVFFNVEDILWSISVENWICTKLLTNLSELFSQQLNSHTFNSEGDLAPADAPAV